MFSSIKNFSLDHPIIVGYATTAAAVVVTVVVSTKIDNYLTKNESE
jgi:hypothetical protein